MNISETECSKILTISYDRRTIKVMDKAHRPVPRHYLQAQRGMSTHVYGPMDCGTQCIFQGF